MMSAELAESLETIQAQETHIGNQEEMLAALQDESTDLRVDLQRGAELAAAGKAKYAALAVQLQECRAALAAALSALAAAQSGANISAGAQKKPKTEGGAREAEFAALYAAHADRAEKLLAGIHLKVKGSFMQDAHKNLGRLKRFEEWHSHIAARKGVVTVLMIVDRGVSTKMVPSPPSVLTFLTKRNASSIGRGVLLFLAGLSAKEMIENFFAEYKNKTISSATKAVALFAGDGADEIKPSIKTNMLEFKAVVQAKGFEPVVFALSSMPLFAGAFGSRYYTTLVGAVTVWLIDQKKRVPAVFLARLTKPVLKEIVDSLLKDVPWNSSVGSLKKKGAGKKVLSEYIVEMLDEVHDKLYE